MQKKTNLKLTKYLLVKLKIKFLKFKLCFCWRQVSQKKQMKTRKESVLKESLIESSDQVNILVPPFGGGGC